MYCAPPQVAAPCCCRCLPPTEAGVRRAGAADDNHVGLVGAGAEHALACAFAPRIERAGRGEGAAGAGVRRVQVGLGRAPCLRPVVATQVDGNVPASTSTPPASITSPASVPVLSNVATPARLAPIVLAAALQVLQSTG